MIGGDGAGLRLMGRDGLARRDQERFQEVNRLDNDGQTESSACKQVR